MVNQVMERQDNMPVRDIQVITAEIKDLCRQARSMALVFVVEIGRRLAEAKEALPHGAWGTWLKDEVGFSQSTANNYMRLFEEYGAAQISIFGAMVNSQSIGNLPYTKALQLLSVPEEEREKFAEEVDAENISVSELKAAIEARDLALQREAEMKARFEELEAAAMAADMRADETDMLKEILAAEKQKAEAAVIEAERLKAKLKEAEKNPKISKATLEQLKKEAEEAEKKKNEKVIAEVEKALADAQEREREARLAEKQAKERLDMAEKKLKTANPEVTAFKTLFDSMQGMAEKLRSMIVSIRNSDPETAEKLTAALKAFGASL